MTRKIEKVKDPSKKVTDERIIADLVSAGRDPDYVEFYEDYSEKSPNAKTYRDRETGEFIKKFSMVSRIHNGYRIDRTWRVTQQGWAYGGRNMYATSVHLATGRTILRHVGKQDIHTEWTPVVRLNGKELPIISLNHVETETSSRQIRNNIIEWDYGACRRTLSLLHGALVEWFIFDDNPGGDVEIESSYPEVEDSEWCTYQKVETSDGEEYDEIELGPIKKIPKAVFEKCTYPLKVDDSTDYYASASLTAQWTGYDDDWDDIRDSTSESFVTGEIAVGARYYPYVSGDYRIIRSAMRINTAGLDDSAVISSATIHMYCNYSRNDDAAYEVYCGPYTGGAFGSTDFNNICTAYWGKATCTAGSWDSWTGTSIKDEVSKTGYSEYGFRNEADYDDDVPSGRNLQQFDSPSESNPPYLTVVYTIPVTYVARPMIFN